MQRKASAVWQGSLQTGSGQITTESGVLKQTPYSFSKRFGDVLGTNPEELIAAAHSSCYAMALTAALSQKSIEPKILDVSATVSLEKQGAGWSVTASRLNLKAKVPGIEKADFMTVAEDAKKNCPISKLLNAEISLEVMFEA